MVMDKDNIYLYVTLFVFIIFNLETTLWTHMIISCYIVSCWKLTCQLSSTLQGTTQDASNPFTVPVLIFYTLFMFALHSLWKVNIRPRHVIGRPLGRPTSQSDCSSLLDYSIETDSRSVFIIQYRIQSPKLTCSSLLYNNYKHIFINFFYKLTILQSAIKEIFFNKNKV